MQTGVQTAGALQAALDRTEEEFIAVFDADFIPPPDFLVSSKPYFLHEESLGIIQCRWTHTNRNYNVLTGAIAIGIDVHFLIEQAGRDAFGLSGRPEALLKHFGLSPDDIMQAALAVIQRKKRR